MAITDFSPEPNQRTLQVKTFGTLSIEGMGQTLKEEQIRSRMLTKLFSYIIMHHRQEMTVLELSEALWPDDSSNNPAGALKNLMYRLRTLFKKVWGADDFIITGHGSYNWNQNIKLVIDAEVFDETLKRAALSHSREEKILLYQQGLSLYRGDFLPMLESEYWVVTLGTYYQSAFLSSVKKLIAMLEADKRYDDMADWCSAALHIEPLDEELHTAMIRVLVAQNKTKLALDHYQEAKSLLYENLGVSPSEELRNIYLKLLEETNTQEMDIGAIVKDLSKDEEHGAFICEYGVFKKIYHLESRRTGRLGISVFLLLVTVEPTAAVAVSSKAYLDIVSESMTRLQDVLYHSLRSGDVVSQYSGAQYIVLLPTCQYETTKRVIKRIEKRFYDTSRKLNTKLIFSFCEVEEKDTNP